MVGHRFGGPWTEIKLDAVHYYLQCYTNALSHIFDLYYVDAFAGSGDRVEEKEIGGILEGRPVEKIVETLDGSAKRALSIAPPFHHFIFNETNSERLAALDGVRCSNADRDIRIFSDDANRVLRDIFSAKPWSKPSSEKFARAAVFLDPYALHVDWATLELLANTRAVDVWYLFPLRDVTRQLALSRDGIGPKDKMLDRVLSPAWRDLYALPTKSTLMAGQQGDLFAPQVAEPQEERTATQKQIENWFQQRLASIFAYASEPLPLLTGAHRQAFSLFLCVANPSKKATDLARQFHRYVMKNFAPGASRQKSFP